MTLPHHLTPDRRTHKQRVADDIRAKILAGALKPGQLLRPQRELVDEYRVSVTTVREAVALLHQEGLVDSYRGRGVEVRRPATVRRTSSDRYRRTLEAIAAGDHAAADSAFAVDHGVHNADVTVDCDFGAEPAPPAVAYVLEIEPEALAFRREMVWYLRDKDGGRQPEQIRECWHPLQMVEGSAMTDPSQQPWPGGVIAELAALGVTITSIDEEIESRPPTPEEAQVLGVRGGTNVFVIHRVGRDHGRAVEVARIIMPTERNRLHYRLEFGDGRR